MSNLNKSEIKRIINSKDFEKLKDALSKYYLFNPSNYSYDFFVETFYQFYNNEDISRVEFYTILRDYLRVEILNKFSKSNNLIEYQPVPENKKAEIIEFRENALVLLKKILSKYTSLDKMLDVIGKDFHNEISLNDVQNYLAHSVICSCSDEQLYAFYCSIQQYRDNMVQYYKDRCKKCQESGDTKDLELSKIFLEYYQNTDLFEIMIPMLYNKGVFLQDNGLFSHNIQHKMSSIAEKDLENLQFLNNLVEFDKLGYIKQNTFFNGNNFVTALRDPDAMFTEFFADKSKVLDSIMNGVNLVEIQSKIAYTDEKILDMLREQKYYLGSVVKENDDKMEKYQLYNNFLIIPSYPLYIKHTTFSKENKTYSIALYVCEKDNINCTTQLFRIDRELEQSKWGSNVHKQKGGEKIEKKVHIHLGTNLEQLLCSDKLKGDFDIFQNFELYGQLDLRIANAIFNFLSGTYDKEKEYYFRNSTENENKSKDKLKYQM